MHYLHCTIWTTDYSNPYYRNSRTQSVVPSYHKACSSHPIIPTIVAIKLANFEPVFYTFAFWLICVNRMYNIWRHDYYAKPWFSNKNVCLHQENLCLFNGCLLWTKQLKNKEIDSYSLFTNNDVWARVKPNTSTKRVYSYCTSVCNGNHFIQ